MPVSDKQLLYQLAATADRLGRNGQSEAAIALWMARKYLKTRLQKANTPR